MDLEGIAAEKEGGEMLLIRKVCFGPNSPKMLGRPVAKVGLLAIWEGVQRVGIDVHPPVDHVPGHHFSLPFLDRLHLDSSKAKLQLRLRNSWNCQSKI